MQGQGYPVYRHWHYGSEKYAGCDSLLTTLREGWVVVNIISYRHQLGGYRTTTIHYVSLKRDHETALMALVSNPYADQFVSRFCASSVSSMPVISSNETNNHSQKLFVDNQGFVWRGRDTNQAEVIAYTPEIESSKRTSY